MSRWATTVLLVALLGCTRNNPEFDDASTSSGGSEEVTSGEEVATGEESSTGQGESVTSGQPGSSTSTGPGLECPPPTPRRVKVDLTGNAPELAEGTCGIPVVVYGAVTDLGGPEVAFDFAVADCVAPDNPCDCLGQSQTVEVRFDPPFEANVQPGMCLEIIKEFEGENCMFSGYVVVLHAAGAEDVIQFAASGRVEEPDALSDYLGDLTLGMELAEPHEPCDYAAACDPWEAGVWYLHSTAFAEPIAPGDAASAPVPSGVEPFVFHNLQSHVNDVCGLDVDWYAAVAL